MKNLFEKNKELRSIVNSIDKAGGIAYLVGGAVRDFILDTSIVDTSIVDTGIVDIDIEVHNLDIDKLELILKSFGHVRMVGKKFGVFRVDGLNIDWSLPRKDSSGRKPNVVIIPDLGIEEACRRRDLTMNAMAINLLDPEETVIDPYGGLNDIKNKVLKAVDEKLFLEDPLRFYRVMQFIGRFEMDPDESLNKLCKSIDLKEVAKERIYEELKKLFLKSKSPSRGFRWLKDIGRLDIFPELLNLVGVNQKPKYHPEGDVFEHSMQALDASTSYTDQSYSGTDESKPGKPDTDQSDKLLIMFGALCHDLGKPAVTTDDLSCLDHEKAGVDITKAFLNRFMASDLIKSVSKLVLYHMLPFTFLLQKSGLAAYRRLAAKLAPEVNMRQLGLIALYDMRGRNGKSKIPLSGYDEKYNMFISKAKKAGVENGPEEPVLKGRHLIGIVEPGQLMGKLLSEAYKIQIEEGETNLEELKRRVTKSFL